MIGLVGLARPTRPTRPTPPTREEAAPPRRRSSSRRFGRSFAAGGCRAGGVCHVQRLIEQPVDEGDVWEGLSRLGRVRYHLAVYQMFSMVEDEPVPASLDVEGH